LPKRYVLLVANGEFSEADIRELSLILEGKYGKLSVIPVQRNTHAVIVKTTNTVAPYLQETSGQLHLGEKRIAAVSTSGSIGKLKSIASGSRQR